MIWYTYIEIDLTVYLTYRKSRQILYVYTELPLITHISELF